MKLPYRVHHAQHYSPPEVLFQGKDVLFCTKEEKTWKVIHAAQDPFLAGDATSQSGKVPPLLKNTLRYAFLMAHDSKPFANLKSRWALANATTKITMSENSGHMSLKTAILGEKVSLPQLVWLIGFKGGRKNVMPHASRFPPTADG